MKSTMIGHNDVFITRSGRQTQPHPKIFKSTHRMLKAHRQWLKNEAITEAQHLNDEYNLTLCHSLDPDNWTKADQEVTLLYVFGSHETLKKSQ